MGTDKRPPRTQPEDDGLWTRTATSACHLGLQPASLPCRFGLASPHRRMNGFPKINLSPEIHTCYGFCFPREWWLTQPESEFSRVCESYSLYHDYSTLPFLHGSGPRQHINKSRPCLKKTSFHRTAYVWAGFPPQSSLPTPAPRHRFSSWAVHHNHLRHFLKKNPNARATLHMNYIRIWGGVGGRTQAQYTHR